MGTPTVPRTVVTAETNTELFSVQINTEMDCSVIFVVNQGDTERHYSIALVDGALGDVTDADYIAKEFAIPARTTLPVDVRGTLPYPQTVLVWADHAEVTFMSFTMVEDLS